MMLMHRREFVRYAGFAGLVGLGTVPGAFAATAIKPGPKDGLIVVDVQNCFVDGGTLPVKGGAEVLPAPLGPIRASISPAARAKLTSSTAWIPPNALDRPRTASKGAVLIGVPSCGALR